jgi:hypothetical protein
MASEPQLWLKLVVSLRLLGSPQLALIRSMGHAVLRVGIRFAGTGP